MTSQPKPIPADGRSSRASVPFGGISLLRSQLAADHPFSSKFSAPTNTNLVQNASPTPNDQLTNPYEGIAVMGSKRNCNISFEFPPTTQRVIRGGFRKLPRQVILGDPDFVYMMPHFPPKGNDFYELTSDGRLSENYFENNKIRAFLSNPGLSIISAGLSPKQNEKEDNFASATPLPNRVYIGQGNYRQTDEIMSPLRENKLSYRHKNAQMPTLPEGRPWQQQHRQKEQDNGDFWGIDHEEMLEEHSASRLAKQLEEHNLRGEEPLNQNRDAECERERSRILYEDNSTRGIGGNLNEDCERRESQAQYSIRQFEGHKYEERERETSHKQYGDNTIHSLHGNTNNQCEHEMIQAKLTIPYLEASKNQASANIHEFKKPETPNEPFPPYGTYTNMPGDRSGDNSRIGRTRTELECTMFPIAPTHNPARDDVSLTPEESSDSDGY